MANAIELISHVARRLIQCERQFEAAPAGRRRAASDLFLDLAGAVEALEAKLRADGPLEGECRRMLACLPTFTAELAGALGEREAGKLAEAWMAACDPGRLRAEYLDADQAGFRAAELSKAHILIRALGEGIRLPVGPASGAGGMDLGAGI